MTKTMYPEVWDLDVFFKGGSESPQLREHLNTTTKMLKELRNDVEQFKVPSSGDQAEEVAELIEKLKNTAMNLQEAGAVIGCLAAQDTTDKKAVLLGSEIASLRANLSTSLLKLQQTLTKTEENVWSELLKSDQLSPFTFVLNEWRVKAKLLLSEEEEILVTALGVDGYHAWGELYDALIGEMKVKVKLGGEEKELSVGQANNLSSDPDAHVRKDAFDALESAFEQKEDFFAKTLNHLAGFRLAVYEKRGWDQVLSEPLQINRMKQETLDAMWDVITAYKQPFVDYLNQKAKILGKEKMNWYDLDAPITSSTQKISYQEGAEFILKHFAKFGQELTSMAKTALEDGWVEAEDRPNKQPGGYCTGMPLSNQSRIFMTYSGTMSNVSTLAHELGHAFHSYALRPVHWMNRLYAMGVAETASTFAEMIVADAAVKEAGTPEEKLSLLEDKIQRSVAFFMNIHARFLFETRFYEERKKGIVSASRLNELMEEAQREAYGGALDVAHPHFWASKMHFYITGVPFYNFPYTFGYLFSLSIYAKALEEGSNFEEKYIALLRDTAVMTVEDLALKHLGEDVTQRAFWEKGVQLCVKDVEEFLTLTKG